MMLTWNASVEAVVHRAFGSLDDGFPFSKVC